MSATGHCRTTLPFRLVVAVASLGGLSSLSRLLAGLPDAFDVPLLLVQHRSPTADPERQLWLLQRHTTLPVRLAQPGAAVSRGITVMPAGSLVTINEHFRLRFSDSPSIAARRHAGDRLFSSAALHLGRAVIGIVLSGNLDDGTEGARAIKRAGGRVLAEDPVLARAPSMPTSAIATGCVDHVLPSDAIAAAVVAFTMAVGAAELFTVPTPQWARLDSSMSSRS